MNVMPFWKLGERIWVVVNWRPDIEKEEKLELRPLTDEENEWVQKALEDAYSDVFGRLARRNGETSSD